MVTFLLMKKNPIVESWKDWSSVSSEHLSHLFTVLLQYGSYRNKLTGNVRKSWTNLTCYCWSLVGFKIVVTQNMFSWGKMHIMSFFQRQNHTCMNLFFFISVIYSAQSLHIARMLRINVPLVSTNVWIPALYKHIQLYYPTLTIQKSTLNCDLNWFMMIDFCIVFIGIL